MVLVKIFFNVFTDDLYNLSLSFTTSFYHIFRVYQKDLIIVRIIVSGTNIVGYYQVGIRFLQLLPCSGNKLFFRYIGFGLETDENSLVNLFDMIYDLWGSGKCDDSAPVALNLRVRVFWDKIRYGSSQYHNIKFLPEFLFDRTKHL